MENNLNKSSGTGNDSKSSSMEEPANSVMHSDFVVQQDNEKDEFPGYPHYPASEDILNPVNSEGKVDVDVENLSQSSMLANIDFTQVNTTPSETDMAYPDSAALKDEDDDLGIVLGTEADVTAEDLIILGEKDQDMDLGEDEDIRNRSGFPLNRTGDDLDVPGAEDDDANENIGEEDEENNYYSLGDDERDNIENDD